MMGSGARGVPVLGSLTLSQIFSYKPTAPEHPFSAKGVNLGYRTFMAAATSDPFRMVPMMLMQFKAIMTRLATVMRIRVMLPPRKEPRDRRAGAAPCPKLL